jgi:glycosyltransferase involved in cell wall biosynthesis
MAPHKNIDTLVRAFAKVKADLPLLKLVLTGLTTKTSLALTALAEELSIGADVNFTGRVTDSELVNLYQRASVMVFPSFYEGFGLPPLEAMACGCPVIASNASAVPEVVGTAALLFDPSSADQLAASIRTVLTRHELREELIDRGLSNSRRFTWEETARRTLQIYERCVRG